MGLSFAAGTISSCDVSVFKSEDSAGAGTDEPFGAASVSPVESAGSTFGRKSPGVLSPSPIYSNGRTSDGSDKVGSLGRVNAGDRSLSSDSVVVPLAMR